MNDLFEALDDIGRDALRAVWRAIAFGIVAGVLFVFVLNAAAQTPPLCPKTPSCDPETQRDRRECGAELKGRTATGEWRAYWFVTAKSPTRWEWCPYKWAMLDKFTPTDPRTIITIVETLKDAPDRPAAIAQLLTQHSITPAPGTQDAYDFAMLHFAACQALMANLPASPMLDTLPPCVQPAPPTPPVEWKAYGGTIYKHAGGKLASIVHGKTAAKGAACVGPAVASAGALLYRRLAGGPDDEATRCVQ